MSTEMETVQLRSKATPRQEANRKNAQKSTCRLDSRRETRRWTGPRTIEGKEASSQNALKHGLCANRNVIRTESQEQYDTFRDEMIADISPAGAMELMLAERIVSLSWRLKRAEHFQNSALNALIERDLIDSGYGWNDKIRRQAKDEAAEGNFDLVLGIIINRDFTRDKTLENLLAYEHRIESRLYRAIAELKKMQAIRREQEKKHEKEAVVENNDEHISQNVLLRSASCEGQESNPSSPKSFDATGPASSEDHAAKRTQFGNDLVCTAHPTVKD